MKKYRFYLLLFALGSSILACKGTDPEDKDTEQEEELITTLELMFEDSLGTKTSFIARDTDGIGGNPIEIDTLFLNANSTYTLSLKFSNESVSPTEDITTEIQQEADEHLVCYSTNTTIDVIPTDSDGNLPIGLENVITTEAIESGSIQFSLKHQPGGIKTGDCSIGETDIEVEFPVVIQ